MAGLSGTLLNDPRSRDSLGTDAFSATTSEGLGAQFGQSFSENPTPLIARSLDRAAQDGVAPDVLEHWRGYRDPAGRNENSDAQAAAEEGAGPPPEPRTMLSPEQANERFKLPGLKFDAPVSERVGQMLYDTHKEALAREDVIRRAGGGVGFAAMKLGASFLAGMMDPLNIASAFIPVVPEAMLASKLAGAASAVGRTAVRVGAGAAEGAVGQALLEPGQMFFNARELNDYEMMDSLNNILFGAALGGGIRGVLGRLIDPRMPPEEVRAIAGTAIAQMVEGRPVDVTDLVDLASARETARRLNVWFDKIDRTMNRAELDIGPSMSRGAAIADAEDRLLALRQSAESLRQEHADVSARAHIEGLDPTTKARLAEVEAELGRVIPKARRASLEQERQLLTEGTNTDPVSSLEGARDKAQQTGLSVALARTEAEAAKTEAKLSSMREADVRLTAEEDKRRVELTRAEKIQQARTASREDVIQGLVEKELKRFAYQAGVKLEQSEVSATARELMTYGAADYQKAVAMALNSIVQRSTAEAFQGAREALTAPRPNTARLEAQASEAAQSAARKAVSRYEDPDIQRAQQANASAIRNAAASAETPAGMERELQKLLDDAKAAYDVEVKAGRVVEDAETTAALQRAKEVEAMGKAEAEAVSCVAKGLN